MRWKFRERQCNFVYDRNKEHRAKVNISGCVNYAINSSLDKGTTVFLAIVCFDENRED